MPHSPLSHTADTGLEATAPDLASLIVELATGMFELMAAVDPCPDQWQHYATIEATSNEDLVVDCLSELLYMSEVENTHFCRFEVAESGEAEVTIKMAGVPTPSVDASGPSIKAVTYHQLEVTERHDGWYGKVYFDV